MQNRTVHQLHVARKPHKSAGPQFMALSQTDPRNAADIHHKWDIMGRNCLSLTGECHAHFPQPVLPQELPRPDGAACQSELCMHAKCADSPATYSKHMGGYLQMPSACIIVSHTQFNTMHAATGSCFEAGLGAREAFTKTVYFKTGHCLLAAPAQHVAQWTS